jgi:hypothetical protein
VCTVQQTDNNGGIDSAEYCGAEPKFILIYFLKAARIPEQIQRYTYFYVKDIKVHKLSKNAEDQFSIFILYPV